MRIDGQWNVDQVSSPPLQSNCIFYGVRVYTVRHKLSPIRAVCDASVITARRLYLLGLVVWSRDGLFGGDSGLAGLFDGEWNLQAEDALGPGEVVPL